MKLGTSKKIHYDSGPNMTPMVDVVMVILVFLMLAGSFAGAEHYLVSNLPYTKSGGGNAAPPPGGFPNDVPLEIRVDTNATRDGFVARVGQYQARNEQQLVGHLNNMREKFARELGKTLEYESDDVRVRAETLVLRGSVQDLSPEQALAAVLATTPFQQQQTASIIRIRL